VVHKIETVLTVQELNFFKMCYVYALYCAYAYFSLEIFGY